MGGCWALFKDGCQFYGLYDSVPLHNNYIIDVCKRPDTFVGNSAAM